MLPDLVAEMRKASQAFSSLKSVTNVRTLVDIVNTFPCSVDVKMCNKEVHMLVKLLHLSLKILRMKNHRSEK